MVTKLRWAHLANRPKDIMDIQAVLHIQGDNLDWPYIEGWCEKHGTRLLLDQLRGELGME